MTLVAPTESKASQADAEASNTREDLAQENGRTSRPKQETEGSSNNLIPSSSQHLMLPPLRK